MDMTDDVKKSQDIAAECNLLRSNTQHNYLDVLKSEMIFQGQHQRVIEHGGERYTLRITKQGKLILTK